MKRIFMPVCFVLSAFASLAQNVKPAPDINNDKDSFYLLSPVEVRAIRAGENSPFSKTNLSAKMIRKANLGQDIPFILNHTPSVVINSDAGNGIGYTGIRIRGTDATRINVTLNGIPYNDAESQGSFFVDLPDFSSSTGSIQIQRGVGTSSNGAGAFGASINFSTNEVNEKPYAEFNNSVGSFNTWKNTLKAGTGLTGDHFTTDIRLSRISSNGFIDRASSNLKSYHLSTAYNNGRSSLRLNIFSGKEKTYQAWYGIAEADRTAGNRTVNYAGTENPGEPYDNETDNYRQDHYQLFFNQRIRDRIHFNTTFFYTKGSGYYEQYKASEPYSSYGLQNPGSSDFIRQLWLDNDFYGSIFSVQYSDKKTQAVLGGAYTRYEGDHFGELIWALNGLPIPNYRWYDLNALKTDFNIYIREQTQFAKNWHLFYDLQYRYVNYIINGFRNNPAIQVRNKFNFLNPKAGISYKKNGWIGYLSWSIANKEPNRDDLETGASQQPGPERLNDLELSVEKTKSGSNWSATFYYMRYKDQLVLTGRINDVGAYTRVNIPRSYRMGIEMQGGMKFSPWVNVSANFAVSENKVLDFNEYIDDYDNGGQKLNSFSKTAIAFSPSLVGAAVINFLPMKDLEFSLLSKYVSKQYLDNTQNENRKLDAFYVQDARLNYTFPNKWLNEITITGQVNNLLNVEYEPNGYTYNYIYGGELVVNNYYFPMSGINFIAAINLKF